MSDELKTLKIVTSRLHKARIAYTITGSIAANYYTVPRMTRDIDIIIELKSKNVQNFIDIFQKDFYIDKEMVHEEVKRHGMFNIIHNHYVIKIDFIVKKDSLYHESAFARKKRVSIEKALMWFMSPEDLILSKLEWAQDSLSEIQLQDIRNMFESVKNLDMKYVQQWVNKLNLQQILNKVKKN